MQGRRWGMIAAAVMLWIAAVGPAAVAVPASASAAMEGAGAAAGAEEVKRHPIDVEIDRLAERDPSTAGQVQAYDRGLELWDAELNRSYQALTRALAQDAPALAALKKAQRAWLAFRDLEIELLARIYARKEGTMFRPMAAYDVLKITRARALELRAWVDLLEGY